MELVSTRKKQQPDSINVRDIIYLCLTHWHWFLLSLIVFMGAAVYYLLVTPPSYTRTASILIKDKKSGQASEVSAAFSDLSVFNSTVNITNELENLHTPDLVQEVVSRLNLDYDYTTPGRFHAETLYGTTLPITVDFIDVPRSDSANARIELLGKDEYKISDFNHDELSQSYTAAYGDTISTPIGRVVVNESKDFTPNKQLVVDVKKVPLSAAAASYGSRLSVTQQNEKSSIINITITDVNVQQADDFLNTLIAVYNENWVKDKNQIAVSTSMFINDRLGVIESELGNVDSDISTFKSENLMPDVAAAATMAINQATQADAAIKDLNNQVYMARYVRNYLANSANNSDLIPVTSGVDNMNIANQIGEYNTQMMERNSLLSHTSDKNPLIQEMDKNLDAMRSALVASIDNQIVGLNAQIKTMQGYGGRATAQIANNPKQAKYLLSVERQQKVKEELYLYLLQKREENELSQAFTAYNTRVMMAPGGSSLPTSPQKKKVLLLAFVLGLALPLAFIFLQVSMDNVVRGRKDLNTLAVPFLGELPQSGKDPNKGLRRRTINYIRNLKKEHGAKVKPELHQSRDIVVSEQSRDSVNEAFRVLRTNLEFMNSDRKDKGIIVAITSANPGSGKTFVAYNLALSLAIKGKRTIAIDLDLRKGSLSRYIGNPNVGISNYLVGQTDEIPNIIVHTETNDKLTHSFDIIPIGYRPPNPTELLFSDRLTDLLSLLEKLYDYIILDCPPVEIVADASIINQYADETIFIIRAGKFDKAMLPEIQKYYDEKRYRNMSILLNGTEGAGNKYGYKYGYRYGYKYGYHYGY